MSTRFAFPQPIPDGVLLSEEAARAMLDEGGMTLRDYFAASALPALITESYVRPAVNPEDQLDVARMAYAIADEMLKERDR